MRANKPIRIEIRNCLRQLTSYTQLEHLIEVTVVQFASPIHAHKIATHQAIGCRATAETMGQTESVAAKPLGNLRRRYTPISPVSIPGLQD